jgi:hypothetical protein
MGSLTFETAPLETAFDMLGPPIVTLDVACDKPIANLVVRLCDVHPSEESLRVSYGVLNLTHRDGHETPTPLVPGQRYRVRIQLNDTGSTLPAGHRIRLAISTSYWPMIWPSPEKATVTIFGGALDLPVRSPRPTYALPPFPDPETAPPERVTPIRPGVQRIDRIGLEIGTEGTSSYQVDRDNPLSAVAEVQRADTVSRGAWQIRIETHLRVTCTREAFGLSAALRAWEGPSEVCCRVWDHSIPRDSM